MCLAHAIAVGGTPNVPSKCDFVDSAIKTQVYAHQSLNGGPVASIENEEGSMTDNRTLALRGDAILRLALIELVQELYPRLTQGGQTTVLSAMLSNETMARISDAFGFPSRIAAAGHQVHIIRTNTEARATVFEAYVGGLAADGKDQDSLRTHIHAIYRPLVAHEYTHVKSGKALTAEVPAARTSFIGPHPVAGPRLTAAGPRPAAGQAVAGVNYISLVKEHNECRGRRGKTIEYRDEQTGPSHCPTFYSTIHIGGAEVGSGEGANKQQARQGASFEAYQDRLAIWGY